MGRAGWTPLTLPFYEYEVRATHSYTSYHRTERFVYLIEAIVAGFDICLSPQAISYQSVCSLNPRGNDRLRPISLPRTNTVRAGWRHARGVVVIAADRQEIAKPGRLCTSTEYFVCTLRCLAACICRSALDEW